MPNILHDCREVRKDIRIRDVFFLRHVRHDEVPAHDPDDQLAVFRVQPVTSAELLRVDGAKFRMAAATAFGDVVENRRNVEHPRAIKVADQLAAERIFVAELGFREAAQIAQHAQDVLVDRIGVEEVVLHLADDRAKVRQVKPEDVELVHPAEFVQYAARLFEQLDEAHLVLRVVAESVVDQRPRAPKCADRACRHPFQFGMLLHDQEGFKNRGRLLVEDFFIGDVQQLVGVLEAFVDRLRDLLRRWKDRRAHVLEQNRVELGD